MYLTKCRFYSQITIVCSMKFPSWSKGRRLVNIKHFLIQRWSIWKFSTKCSIFHQASGMMNLSKYSYLCGDWIFSSGHAGERKWTICDFGQWREREWPNCDRVNVVSRWGSSKPSIPRNKTISNLVVKTIPERTFTSGTFREKSSKSGFQMWDVMDLQLNGEMGVWTRLRVYWFSTLPVDYYCVLMCNIWYMLMCKVWRYQYIWVY